ncbi:MAG: ABC transporter permease [Actinomycetota bacterium]|nr:ABC transporter permease [Actinomycetota bacterium]
MRWLLVKDLQILRRSPLLVSLLVLYPILLAVLVGFALSRGPDRPRVALLNEVPRAEEQVTIGGEAIDARRAARQLFASIDAVRVGSREEALEKVRDGDVLGALIIPADVTDKLQSGLEPATVRVIYNAEDPVKARFVRDTIAAQAQAANVAVAKRISKIALGYLDLLVRGGDVSFLGREISVLGLERAEAILRAAERGLPRGSPARAELRRVIEFAGLARENLAFSDDLLASVGQPIRVEQTVVEGGATPLSSFAVALSVGLSLMVVTLLLAAGALALEREEHAFHRLVRGLVSRSGLLAEKVVLAAVCAVPASLLMLAGIGTFVDLDWGGLPRWVAALGAGAVAFGAMGVAIGALAREVRAASLLAFMVSLPIAFLALVPSGSVSGGLYGFMRTVSALFPFEPTLDALEAALNGSGSLAPPLLHLAALAAVFGVAARVALRRFG